MGKSFLAGVGYAVIGLVVAIGLTMGAYALAGKDLSEPARPVGAGGALAPKVTATTGPSPSDRREVRQQAQRERQRERIHDRKAAARQQQRQQQRQQEHASNATNGGGGSVDGGSGSDDSGTDDHGGSSGSDDSGSDDSGSDDHSGSDD